MAILPPKVLMIQVTNVNYNDSTDVITDATNPYVGYAYRWEIDVNLPTPQAHSSPYTSTPFWYTTQDINVGDWICTSFDGAALQITQINSVPDANHANVTVEDIEYFNIFNDPNQSGSGGLTDGQGVIFSISNDGLPILMGVTANSMGDTFVTDLISRFNYRNIQQKYVRVNQSGHTFNVGDVIEPNVSVSGTYVLAADGVNDRAVGTVNDVGVPTADWFNFEPFGEVVYNVTPALTGSYGDLFYLDPSNPGKLTNVRPQDNARPIYLRLGSDNIAIKFSAAEEQASETKTFKMSSVTDGETTFTLPSDAFEVVSMLINGIETSNFTYSVSTKTVTFDPAGNGYGIDSTDEVTFVYTT